MIAHINSKFIKPQSQPHSARIILFYSPAQTGIATPVRRAVTRPLRCVLRLPLARSADRGLIASPFSLARHETFQRHARSAPLRECRCPTRCEDAARLAVWPRSDASPAGSTTPKEKALPAAQILVGISALRTATPGRRAKIRLIQYSPNHGASGIR